jgi:GAF domain-containing protein
VVTSTHGEGAQRLLLKRHPEGDPVLIAAMRKRRALVFDNAATSDAAALERYQMVGGVKSLVVAPVMQAGRFLGAIELADPLDGDPYTEADGNALSYIGEQFAEFVAARGVVTDPERIAQNPRSKPQLQR